MRVEEKHTQMVKEGLFRGGKPPYGYKLIKSGEVNKKGKELLKLEINDEESKAVIVMYDLIYEKGWGGNRIVKYLNDINNKMPPSRSGKKWSLGVVNYILRNPIYKGYMVYGKTKSTTGTKLKQNKEDWVLSEKPISELVIIPEEKWDVVQHIRESRTPEKMKKNGDNIDRSQAQYPTKSPLLFVGRIRCGHCGSPLTTTYNYKVWMIKDGTEKRKLRVKYRCSGKALGKTNCDGQTIYAQDRIETAVLDEIYKYLEQLKKIDLAPQIEKIKNKNVDAEIIEIKNLQNLNEENYQELAVLHKEVPKSLLGKSKFSKELLTQLLNEKEKEIQETSIKISELENKIKNNKFEVDEMKQLQNWIPVWKEEFEQADVDKKKMMLVNLIEEVIVRRDEIDVKIKCYVKNFIASAKKELWVQDERSWECV